MKIENIQKNDSSFRAFRKTAGLTLLLLLFCSFAAFGAGAAYVPGNFGPGMVGWIQMKDGGWQYYNAGVPVKNGWQQDGAYKYLFDQDGRMLTGWQTFGENSYYLTEVSTEGHPAGSCYTDAVTPDGCVVNTEGIKVSESIWVTEEGRGHENPTGIPTVLLVEIGAQHAYLYLNQVLAWDSPCVTGNESNNHATPRGNFTILYKERDRYLTGPVTNGKPAWKNWVSFWMPFTYDGCGFHDATWRGAFGGTIYQYAGSHGCVNLPPNKAGELYNLVSAGMQVVVQ